MANAKSAGGASGVEIDEDDLQRMRFRKAMARKKRHERDAEGEIKELNITAMMDIMTIILVFLIKSYATSSVTMTSSEDLKPPISTTRATPKDTIAVTITPKHVLVGDKPKVELENAQLRPGDLAGRLIVPLDQALKKEVEKLKTIEERGGTVFSHELTVIGDKRIQYDLLMSVLYTAGQNELENYRFIVIQKE
ncbi:MAG: biopolymer transporter ExbD [Myxococcaceae bacterium]|nr:biopolymer transporter ExbD [Myxococcaceae bacterium]